MVSDNNEIKMKVAAKLVNMLSLNENNEEEFFQAIKTVFVNIIGSDDELDSIIKTFREIYSYDEVIGKITEVYAKHFTEDEMIDMINFYNTPTGQTWLKKHPLVISEIMEVNHKYGAAITEEIIKKMDK